MTKGRGMKTRAKYVVDKHGLVVAALRSRMVLARFEVRKVASRNLAVLAADYLTIGDI